MTRWEAETAQSFALIDAGHPRLAVGLAVVRSTVARICALGLASGLMLSVGLPSAVVTAVVRAWR